MNGEFLVAVGGLVFSLVAFFISGLGGLAWFLFRRVREGLDENNKVLVSVQVEQARMAEMWTGAQRRAADFEERILKHIADLTASAANYMEKQHAAVVHLADLERRVAVQEKTSDSLDDLHAKIDLIIGTPPDGDLRVAASRRRRGVGVRGGIEPSGSEP